MRLVLTDLYSVFLLGRITQLETDIPPGALSSRASRSTKTRTSQLRLLMAELHQRVWADLLGAGYDPLTCTPPVPTIATGEFVFEAALEWQVKRR